MIFLSSCHGKKPAIPSTPVYPIQITEAATRDVPIFIEALGHVDSITSINIFSRVEGELTGIYFKQGQEVKKGDLLFTIDPKLYQASLKQAQGALEQSLANLTLSEEKVKRYRLLAKDEYYSQIDYESLQADMAANLALVKENQGQVDGASINLDYCWIYAPIDGMTGILQIDYGNLIFEGCLYMLDNTVDAKTGMISLRAIFENKNRELWPGQFIRNRIILQTMKDAVVIPYTAIQITQKGPIVFALKADMTVEQRSVKLGQRMDEQVIVLEGVKGGERIVLEGQINLRNGSKVRIPGKSP